MKGQGKAPQPLREYSKHNIPKVTLKVIGEGWDVGSRRYVGGDIQQHKEWWGADGEHRIPRRSKGGYAKWPILPPIK